MGRGRGIWIILFLTLSSWARLSAYGYTPTLTSNGIQVRWRGEIKLNLVGNPVNRSGISDQLFFSSVIRGLQRWKSASGGRIDFDYWQGRDPRTFAPNSDYNGFSNIHFASNGGDGNHISPNILGLTQVWYKTESGEIIETDVVLNDKDFLFTTNARDTSGFGSIDSEAGLGGNKVFIENVITHELGHVIGLSHSGGLQSSMLFMESPEQARLGCDEQIAVRALYPAGDESLRGAINGSVVSEAGQPIFGAHVLAISRRRGTVLASGMTDRSGRYQIQALEPGTYFLIAEPFLAGAPALPSFYAGINVNICPGNLSFGRSILTGEDGYRPYPVLVKKGRHDLEVPPLIARCGVRGGAAVSGSLSSSRAIGAPVIFNGISGETGFGVSDRFTHSSTAYYRLSALSGHIELHVLSYSLYSPIRTQISIFDAVGKRVHATVSGQVYVGDSGYVNFDSALEAHDLPNGDYIVQVSGEAMNSSVYPAGPVMLDSAPFLIITGSVNEAAPLLADRLQLNARCRMDESFPPYSSPSGPPAPSSGLVGGERGGFCGTVQDVDDEDTGLPPPARLHAIMGWFLPWMLMAMIAQFQRVFRDNRI